MRTIIGYILFGILILVGVISFLLTQVFILFLLVRFIRNDGCGSALVFGVFGIPIIETIFYVIIILPLTLLASVLGAIFDLNL